MLEQFSDGEGGGKRRLTHRHASGSDYKSKDERNNSRRERSHRNGSIFTATNGWHDKGGNTYEHEEAEKQR